MNESCPVKEGFVPFGSYRTWYRSLGTAEAAGPGQLPLLCLHGGPGGTHDYLEPLEAMAQTGRRVIFYDQLGNGGSDKPSNPSLWTIGLFVEELAAVRRHLGLERVHLLGHSWGGMLAMEYALTQPQGLASLTLSDTLASAPQWVAEANRLRAGLPPDVRETLSKHEQAESTDDPEYQEAMLVYYRRHLCRIDPWPDCLNRTFELVAQNPEVYTTMWGPSEFYPTGSLKNWDIVDRLGEIRAPALILSGSHDEATPAISETLHRAIAGSRLVIFEESSHVPYIEETERYMRTLDEFLSRVEA